MLWGIAKGTSQSPLHTPRLCFRRDEWQQERYRVLHCGGRESANFTLNSQTEWIILGEPRGSFFIWNIENLRQLKTGILRELRIPVCMLVCCNYSEGSIPRGVLECILTRDCEGAEQLQKLYKTDG